MKMMPVLGKNKDSGIFRELPNEIPFNLLREDRAQRNHGQTLERLRERGGMGYSEIAVNILNIDWGMIEHLDEHNIFDTIVKALINDRKRLR